MFKTLQKTALSLMVVVCVLVGVTTPASAQTYTEGADYNFFYQTYTDFRSVEHTVRFDWNMFGGATDLPYYINQDVIDAGLDDAVQRAFATFENHAASDVSFVYMGATTAVSEIQGSDASCCGTPSDGLNVVSFGQVQSDSIGVGGFAGSFNINSDGTPAGTGNGQFDVTLDQGTNFVDGAQPGAVDAESLVLHELGHALGLGHPHTNQDSIMWGVLPSNFLQRELHAADQYALSLLYPAAGQQDPGPASSSYVSMSPQRLLDTRTSDGPYSTPWTSALTRRVQVTGNGGVPLVNVTAVALHITTVNPTADLSWLSIDPASSAESGTAVHNFGRNSLAAELVNDLVVTKVGSDGAIDITNERGSVELVIDVVGYYSTTDGAGYEPLAPQRLIDSRPQLQVGSFGTPWGPNQSRVIDVAGQLGVPAGATSVVMHVTTVNPTSEHSWLTFDTPGALPSGTAMHNFGIGESVSQIVNDVIVTDLGPNGSFEITNANGWVDVVIDVVGYFHPTGGAVYLSVSPIRALDTRAADIGAYSTPWGPGESRQIYDDRFAGCTAVVVHVTTVSPTALSSWLTVSPETGDLSTASLNFGTNDATRSLTTDVVVAKLNADGSFWITNAHGSVDVVVDLVGLYGPSFGPDGSCSS